MPASIMFKVLDLTEGYTADGIIMDELSYISISFEELAKKTGFDSLNGHVITVYKQDGKFYQDINVDDCLAEGIKGTSMCVLYSYTIDRINDDEINLLDAVQSVNLAVESLSMV